jgi:methylmalonyl-CoA decarboxylase subunit alpha
MIYAYSEATVPKLMVILRKSYGGAYCVMSSKGLRGDLLYAWPNAEIAVMGAEGRSTSCSARGAGGRRPGRRRRELVEDYQRASTTPMWPPQRGLIDDVIEPRDTRRALIRPWS